MFEALTAVAYTVCACMDRGLCDTYTWWRRRRGI